MNFPNNNKRSFQRRPALRIAAAALLAGLAAPASAESLIGSLGLRAGVSDGGEDFTLYEVFARAELPWNWTPGERWRLNTYLETSLGLLDAHGDSGVVVSLGPVAVFTQANRRWEIELGIKPTFLGEDRYGDFDMGGQFHFISHVGVNYRFRQGFTLGYRFQHISNANIEDPNPGLDIHTISASWLLR